METYRKKITPSPRRAKAASADEGGSVRLAAHEDTVGVYIHFPWCLEKCPYCDFLSIAIPHEAIPHVAYADAVCREIDARAPMLSTRKVHSVFFGGGTPSLWQADSLGRVLDHVARRLHLEADTEVSIECNPTSFSRRYGTELQSVGVNRISIGVQGLDDERLGFLGRLHGSEDGLVAIRAALDAKISNVSADLIYGIYRQEPTRAAQEVDRVAELGVHHLSAYALTIEPGTQFGARARKGTLPLLSEDLVADSFDAVSSTLRGRGFEHYEISNFALSDNQCRHNLGYWRGEQYLGLGCGAVGTLRCDDEVVRYRNVLVPERYLGLRHWTPPNERDAAHHSVERLSPETLLQERLLLGLRLLEGVSPARIERDLGVVMLTDERRRTAGRLQRQGRLEASDERWRIPPGAWLFADAVIRDLL